MVKSNLARLSLAFLLLVGLVVGGCVRPEPSATTVPTSLTPESPLTGVSLSPKSFQAADFTGFFQLAAQAGDIVSWAGDWQELSSPNSGANTVAGLAATYGYLPALQLQFFNQDSGTLLRPLDDVTRQSYIRSAVAAVEKYKLKYLGVGIEVNILAAKSPADFDNFVGLFGQVYDAVKSKSPDTKVFTIFQLEVMKGLTGGLFGGANGPVHSAMGASRQVL